MSSQTIAREKTYTDIDFAFTVNPVTGDVGLKKEAEAVKQSVINILSTNRGERPFLPYFGANIRKYLFDNFDRITSSLIDEQIRSALANYEPRVRVINVDTQGRPDQNSMTITLEFEIISPESIRTSVEFVVERLR